MKLQTHTRYERYKKTPFLLRCGEDILVEICGLLCAHDITKLALACRSMYDRMSNVAILLLRKASFENKQINFLLFSEPDISSFAKCLRHQSMVDAERRAVLWTRLKVSRTQTDCLRGAGKVFLRHCDWQMKATIYSGPDYDFQYRCRQVSPGKVILENPYDRGHVIGVNPQGQVLIKKSGALKMENDLISWIIHPIHPRGFALQHAETELFMCLNNTDTSTRYNRDGQAYRDVNLNPYPNQRNDPCNIVLGSVERRLFFVADTKCVAYKSIVPLPRPTPRRIVPNNRRVVTIRKINAADSVKICHISSTIRCTSDTKGLWVDVGFSHCCADEKFHFEVTVLNHRGLCRAGWTELSSQHDHMTTTSNQRTSRPVLGHTRRSYGFGGTAKKSNGGVFTTYPIEYHTAAVM